MEDQHHRKEAMNYKSQVLSRKLCKGKEMRRAMAALNDQTLTSKETPLLAKSRGCVQYVLVILSYIYIHTYTSMVDACLSLLGILDE
jgi:hypothetical protein